MPFGFRRNIIVRCFSRKCLGHFERTFSVNSLTSGNVIVLLKRASSFWSKQFKQCALCWINHLATLENLKIKIINCAEENPLESHYLLTNGVKLFFHLGPYLNDVIFSKIHYHTYGFYWDHQCSWTHAPANSMQAPTCSLMNATGSNQWPI